MEESEAVEGPPPGELRPLLRILHTNMLRGWGGQSNRILKEAVYATEKGHQVALAVPEDSKLAARGAEAGLTVWPGFRMRPPAKVRVFIPDLLRLRRRLAEWRPDIIHVHGSQDTWLVAVARAIPGRSGQIPVVRTKHNIFPWARHSMNRWLYRQLDGTIGISTYIMEQLSTYPELDGKPRVLIPSVPETEAIRAAKGRPEVTRRGVGPQAFVWASTGRLRREKGFDVLLRAWQRVVSAWGRDACRLVIAGDGSDAGALADLAKELGLGEPELEFLGFREDVPELLKAVDGYVLASRSEGLGTAILEALAAELPAVATNVGGIPDSIRHEKTGLLVRPNDPEDLAAAMIRVMDDREFAKRLGAEAGLLIDSTFSRESMGRRTIEFYKEVTKGARNEPDGA